MPEQKSTVHMIEQKQNSNIHNILHELHVKYISTNSTLKSLTFFLPKSTVKASWDLHNEIRLKKSLCTTILNNIVSGAGGRRRDLNFIVCHMSTQAKTCWPPATIVAVIMLSNLADMSIPDWRQGGTLSPIMDDPTMVISLCHVRNRCHLAIRDTYHPPHHYCSSLSWAPITPHIHYLVHNCHPPHSSQTSIAMSYINLGIALLKLLLKLA